MSGGDSLERDQQGGTQKEGGWEVGSLLYPRREAGILWIHHRCRPRPHPRPQRFLVSDLQSTFLSGFLSW